MGERKYYLDWLRVIATLLLIPYHTSRIFDFVPYYIKQENSIWAELFGRFVDTWFMPLFFTIAGMAAFLSISKRGLSSFKRERSRRLMLPLAVALVSVLPAVGYIAFTFHRPELSLSFWQYLPHFFNVDLTQIEGYAGSFSPSHLWFLIYLFLFSVFSKPVFERLNKARIPAWAKRKPLLFFILCLTLARLTGLPYPNPVYFILFFWFGYGLAQVEKEYTNKYALEKNLQGIILVACITMALVLFARMNYLAEPTPCWLKASLQPIYSTNAVLWVGIFLHLGQKFFQKQNSLIAYLNEASLYIYISHMFFIMVIAFFILENFNNTVSFFLICGGVIFSLFAFYEILIKRFNFLRFLFGLRNKASGGL